MCFRPATAAKKEKQCPNEECKKMNPPMAAVCKFCGEKLPKAPAGPAGPGGPKGPAGPKKG